MSESTGSGGRPPDEPEDARFADRFQVWVRVTPDSLDRLLRAFDLDLGDRPVVEPVTRDTGRLVAFATQEQVDALGAAGYDVEVGDNVSDVGRQRQAEVGDENRYADTRATPRGLAEKTSDDGRRRWRR